MHLSVPASWCSRQGLPDFTELAEKHGAEVVNISVTQVAQTGGAAFPFPGMENDENLQEFLRRFGIPGVPGQGGQGGQEYKSQSLGSGFIISNRWLYSHQCTRDKRG